LHLRLVKFIGAEFELLQLPDHTLSYQSSTDYNNYHSGLIALSLSQHLPLQRFFQTIPEDIARLGMPDNVETFDITIGEEVLVFTVHSPGHRHLMLCDIIRV
jgi:hypothetical protein